MQNTIKIIKHDKIVKMSLRLTEKPLRLKPKPYFSHV